MIARYGPLAARVAKRTMMEFSANHSTQMAAALSYYTIFALTPLLVIVIHTAGYLLRAGGFATQREVRKETVSHIESVVGPEVGEQIAEMLATSTVMEGGWWQTAFNIGALIFGATIVFAQLQASLNQSWQVQRSISHGIKGVLIKRLLSLLMVFGIALLFLAMTVLTTALDVLQGRFLDAVPSGLKPWIDRGWLTRGAYLAGQFLVATLFVGAVFKVLPDALLRWRDVITGALVTAAALVLGRYVIAFYLSQVDIGDAFGAAGSLAVLLIWIYYSSLILFLGAEFTHALVVERGEKIMPEAGAVHVVVEEKAASELRDDGYEEPPKESAEDDQSKEKPPSQPPY